MRSWRNDIVFEACEFTARWGFLTQELFFEFMCPMSRAHKFRYWKFLTTSGKFYQSRATEKVLLLTAKGRHSVGGIARPARRSIYVAHDAMAARVLLALQKRDLVFKYWLEDELMRNPLEGYSILGNEQMLKIPDAIFDLRTAGGGTIRCSLEIERTTKSRSRYAKNALAYLGYSKISVMLFAVGTESAKDVVGQAFRGKMFSEQNKIPGIFNLSNFDPTELNTIVRFSTQEMTLKQLLSALTKLEIKSLNFSRDHKETAVSLKKLENCEAA